MSRAACPLCRGSPGQEKVRLGLASLSPPLPQLRRCAPSPPNVSSAAASRSPSPVRSSMRSDPGAAGVVAHSQMMSPSPARSWTAESGGARLSRSPSTVAPPPPTTTMTDLHVFEL
uniref:Uncharacterized protein n=1 Tax=Oryza brachyantha TaxID=4533 RepID=J3MEQ7_ORYBR